MLTVLLAAAALLPAPGAAAGVPDAAGCTGGPVVELKPRAAPAGTRVRIRGRCFEPHLDLRDSGYRIILVRPFSAPRECELVAAGRQRLRVDGQGIARGFFVVPRRGHCFQRDYGRRVTPGRYRLAIGCRPCHVAAFRVRR